MKLKKGLLVLIEFLDHVEDGGESAPFTIMGRVVAITRRDVVVAVWFYGDERDFDPEDGNVKRYAIVRRAIRSAHEIGIQQEGRP